jgi:peptidoglycan/xylan/chitin deacetylase (PgdA/CDA1 family)
MNKVKDLIFYGTSKFFNLLPNNISGVPVLLFHKVGTEEDCKIPSVSCISIDNFELQLNYLTEQRYYFATLDEVVKYVKAEITLPEKTVAITFDDGFQDNHRYAFPVLKQRGINATIFINTGLIERKLSANEAFGVIAPRRKDVLCQFLSWDEIIEMSNNGINFEPHTHTHIDLTAIKESEIEREIKLSKDILEEKLNKSVKHFSYTYGKYNKKVCDIVRKIGFESAWAVRPYNVKPKMDLYTLPRKGSGNMSLERFKTVISDYAKWVFFVKKLCGRK